MILPPKKNDRSDNWYNAQDFGENRHLGEDWNKNTGGNTDCGEPVFAAADGQIVLAKTPAQDGEMLLLLSILPMMEQNYRAFTDTWKALLN